MSSFSTSAIYPVPVAWVAQAAAQAAIQAGMEIQANAPNFFKCHSGLTLMTYPVTVEMQIGGVDGAAQVSVRAHNFGFGPLQTGACRDKTEQILNLTVQVLRAWSAQVPAAPPPPPAPSSGA